MGLEFELGWLMADVGCLMLIIPRENGDRCTQISDIKKSDIRHQKGHPSAIRHQTPNHKETTHSVVDFRSNRKRRDDSSSFLLFTIRYFVQS